MHNIGISVTVTDTNLVERDFSVFKNRCFWDIWLCFKITFFLTCRVNIADKKLIPLLCISFWLKLKRYAKYAIMFLYYMTFGDFWNDLKFSEFSIFFRDIYQNINFPHSNDVGNFWICNISYFSSSEKIAIFKISKNKTNTLL